jgi:putative membrane protein
VKVGMFLAVAVISVQPTLTFIRWRGMLDHDPAWRVDDAERSRMRRYLMIEVHIAAFIPLFAVIMARGLGS